jgi:hypothetical protein
MGSRKLPRRKEKSPRFLKRQKGSKILASHPEAGHQERKRHLHPEATTPVTETTVFFFLGGKYGQWAGMFWAEIVILSRGRKIFLGGRNTRDTGSEMAWPRNGNGSLPANNSKNSAQKQRGKEQRRNAAIFRHNLDIHGA